MTVKAHILYVYIHAHIQTNIFTYTYIYYVCIQTQQSWSLVIVQAAWQSQGRRLAAGEGILSSETTFLSNSGQEDQSRTNFSFSMLTSNMSVWINEVFFKIKLDFFGYFDPKNNI